MTRLRAVLLAASLVVVASAHIGSPDVYFEGNAGPYSLRVIVRAASVVPGLAGITVRVLSGGSPRVVTVLPVFWDPRTAAPPPPDTARLVAGESGLYSAQLWFMRAGTYAVRVTAEGEAGSGMVNVPVQAVGLRRLEMSTGMTAGLAAAALFLLAGLVTFARAAAMESVLAPGAVPDRRYRRRGWIASGVAVVVITVGVFAGRAWWNGVDLAYARSIYRPTPAHISVSPETLTLAIDDGPVAGRRWTPLIPEHGHLVHLFLVRTDLGAFAHLHPVRRDSSVFETAAPTLPPGRYRVYADIVRESGFTETLTDSLELAGGPGRAGDPDDGQWVDENTGVGGASVSLADGSTITWDRGTEPIVAGDEAPLRFTVSGPAGRAARLEPYLGMPGHAVIARTDGGVFVHLHPMGTISWASQQTFGLRTAADTQPGSLARKLEAARPAAHGHVEPADAVEVLSFPYAFPAAGDYRVWVQVKRGGKVLTGSFPVSVAAARTGT